MNEPAKQTLVGWLYQAGNVLLIVRAQLATDRTLLTVRAHQIGFTPYAPK